MIFYAQFRDTDNGYVFAVTRKRSNLSKLIYTPTVRTIDADVFEVMFGKGFRDEKNIYRFITEDWDTI